MLTGGREAAAKGWATRAYAATDLESEVLAIAERVTKLPTELAQINKRSVHRAMEISGMRAAIRARKIQALAFQTEPSKEYMTRFRRDAASVSTLLTERDALFADYRERKDD